MSDTRLLCLKKVDKFSTRQLNIRIPKPVYEELDSIARENQSLAPYVAKSFIEFMLKNKDLWVVE